MSTLNTEYLGEERFKSCVHEVLADVCVQPGGARGRGPRGDAARNDAAGDGAAAAQRVPDRPVRLHRRSNVQNKSKKGRSRRSAPCGIGNVLKRIAGADARNHVERHAKRSNDI